MQKTISTLTIVSIITLSCSKTNNEPDASPNLNNYLQYHTYECFFMKSVSTGKDVYHYLEFTGTSSVKMYYKEGGTTRDVSNSSYQIISPTVVSVDGNTGTYENKTLKFANTTAVPGTTIYLTYKQIK